MLFLFLAALGLCCCTGFCSLWLWGFLQWLLSLQSKGCRAVWLWWLRLPGSRAQAQSLWLSCSGTGGIFPDQGSSQCLLHCQADSLPLSHRGSPCGSCFFKAMGTLPAALASLPSCLVGGTCVHSVTCSCPGGTEGGHCLAGSEQ